MATQACRVTPFKMGYKAQKAQPISKEQIEFNPYIALTQARTTKRLSGKWAKKSCDAAQAEGRK